MSKIKFKYGTIKYINDIEVEIKFCLIDFELKLIPIDWQQTMKIVLDNKFVNEKFIWLKGEFISGEAVNIQVYAPQLVNFILPNSSKFINVGVSMYTISEGDYDISNSFKYIEFDGGILDLVYPVRQIQEFDYKRMSLKLKKKTMQIYKVSNDEEIETIKYFIKPSVKIGKMVDYKDTHTAFVFELKENIKIQSFFKYFIYLSNMLSFLCRQSNIRFTAIRTYNEQAMKEGHINIFINDNYENYIDEVAHINEVISFNSIGKDIVNLYKIIKNKSEQPNLVFLSDDNKDSNNIYYYSPIAITSSMEREYKQIENKFKCDKRLKKAAKKLKDKLQSIIDSEKCDKRIKDKCTNLFNALEDIEPNSKEKFGRLLNLLIIDLGRIKSDISKLYYAKFWLKLDEEKDNLKKLYGDFYRIRGSAAHDVIEWKDNVGKIYGFIEMIIYYFILRRIGVKVTTRFNIIEKLFEPVINETYIQKEIMRKKYEEEGKRILFES